MKIGVVNAVLPNTGDAAIFQAVVHSLRSALAPSDTNVVVFDSRGDLSAKLYPDWDVHQQISLRSTTNNRLHRKLQSEFWPRFARVLARIPRTGLTVARLPWLRQAKWSRSLRELASCDIVVSSGGTYLVDHYNFAPRVGEIILCNALSKPVVMWTQSLGPFATAEALDQAKQLSRIVQAAYFRDERSCMSWTNKVNPHSARAVVPDVVFALERPASKSDRASSRRALISVREWTRGVDTSQFDNAKYERSIREAAAFLLSTGYSVEAVSTCQGVPDYPFDDSRYADQILSPQDVRINHEFHTPSDLLDTISSADITIATRMHMAILCLISRVPVIAIAYEFKTLELFTSLGLGDFVIKIEDVTPQWLTERISKINADPTCGVLSTTALATLRQQAMEPAYEVIHGPGTRGDKSDT